MWSVDLLGYLAGIFLLLMASMNSMTWMRIFNIAGNLTFILYGCLAEVWPVVFLNTAMIGMHVYRLAKAKPA